MVGGKSRTWQRGAKFVLNCIVLRNVIGLRASGLCLGPASLQPPFMSVLTIYVLVLVLLPGHRCRGSSDLEMFKFKSAC